MIISKTPFRISFAGGGSDIPIYYRKFGGSVVSTTIDKYMYIALNKKFDSGIRAAYSKIEEKKHTNDIDHPLIKAALQMLSIEGGVEITSIADIPSSGSGLGSSSSFTVSLLHALHTFLGNYISADDLASQACKIEIEICKEPIGKQDQYAAAYGGLNFIRFNTDDSVTVEPIILNYKQLAELQNHLLLFYTSRSRSASNVLIKQTNNLSTNKQIQGIMKSMVQLSLDLKEELKRGNIYTFGKIMHDNWILKKKLEETISDPEIDYWYSKAIDAGATGGKLLGAGQGGFLLFFAHPDNHAKLINALSDLRIIPLKFELDGSQIIFSR